MARVVGVHRALVDRKVFRVTAVVYLTFIGRYPRTLWLYCVKAMYCQNAGVITTGYSREASFLTVLEIAFINWNDLAALWSKAYRNTPRGTAMNDHYGVRAMTVCRLVKYTNDVVSTRLATASSWDGR